MINRPGYSGSPIWNESFDLYGMGISGTNGDDKRGDKLVCIPRSELFIARQLVDDQIKATLEL